MQPKQSCRIKAAASKTIDAGQSTGKSAVHVQRPLGCARLGVKLQLGPTAGAPPDLGELIALNAKRPYFLLVHVRESNDVNSLVEITKQLDGPVEIVPVDVFLKLAASNQTYTTRYQDPADPKHFKGY